MNISTAIRMPMLIQRRGGTISPIAPGREVEDRRAGAQPEGITDKVALEQPVGPAEVAPTDRPGPLHHDGKPRAEDPDAEPVSPVHRTLVAGKHPATAPPGPRSAR